MKFCEDYIIDIGCFDSCLEAFKLDLRAKQTGWHKVFVKSRSSFITHKFYAIKGQFYNIANTFPSNGIHLFKIIDPSGKIESFSQIDVAGILDDSCADCGYHTLRVETLLTFSKEYDEVVTDVCDSCPDCDCPPTVCDGSITIKKVGCIISEDVLTGCDAPVYKWYKNSMLITGSIQDTITAQEDGSYHLVVECDGCEYKSNTIMISACECYDCNVLDLDSIATTSDFTTDFRFSLNEVLMTGYVPCDTISIRVTEDLISFYDCNIVSITNISGDIYSIIIDIPVELRWALQPDVVLGAGLVFEMNYLFNDQDCGPDITEYYVLATFARTTSPNGCGINLTNVTPQTAFPSCVGGTYTLYMYDDAGLLLDSDTGTLPLSVQDAGHSGLARFVLACTSWNGARYQITTTTC